MEKYMRRAIELAKRGTGFVNPNPLVGAVIVKNGRIIAEGFHERYGEPHAERNAIKNAAEDVRGADMYVTLEPCCHYGKNPPCTDALIESGIRRVYVGSNDPNPLVAGKGIGILREHGIEVTENCLRGECDELNDIFFHYITTKTPFVIMKTAVTLDGKIATGTGSSQWITNEKSRAHVHETRKRAAAILTGVNTVIADDPMLNCRTEDPSNPVRIICDSHLRIPMSSKIVTTARSIPSYVVCTDENAEKEKELKRNGVNIIKAGSPKGRVDLVSLMKTLGEMQLDSVLIEGGGEIFASALKSGIVNKLQVYIAPKIIGADGKDAVAALGISKIDDAISFKSPVFHRFDDDIMLEYSMKGR